jgi:hypothetical protein
MGALWQDQGLVFTSGMGRPLGRGQHELSLIQAATGARRATQDTGPRPPPHLRYPASFQERQPQDRSGDARPRQRLRDDGRLLPSAAGHGRHRGRGDRRGFGLSGLQYGCSKTARGVCRASLLFLCFAGTSLAAGLGFEPRLTDPESDLVCSRLFPEVQKYLQIDQMIMDDVAGCLVLFVTGWCTNWCSVPRAMSGIGRTSRDFSGWHSTNLDCVLRSARKDSNLRPAEVVKRILLVLAVALVMAAMVVNFE